MNTPIENPAYVYQLNPDLNAIDWDYIISLFYKIEWRHRKAEEIAAAFTERQIIWLYALGESLRKQPFSSRVQTYLDTFQIKASNIPNALLDKHN